MTRPTTGQPTRQPPPAWTDERLEDDRQAAIDQFRRDHVVAPLEAYLGRYQAASDSVEALLEMTVDLLRVRDMAVEVLGDERLAHIARHLASPPLSAADLEAMTGVPFAPDRLRDEPDDAARLMSTILLGLDRQRFPWMADARPATDAERETAIVSTAAIKASRAVERTQHAESPAQLARRVGDFLGAQCGLASAAPRDVGSMAEAPRPGEFYPATQIAGAAVDLCARLWDGRLLPVLCAPSSSVADGHDQVARQAADKATGWLRRFGDVDVTPSVVLSGVFALADLRHAQQEGLTLFWEHDLAPLRAFVQATQG